jgi:hypothetical protein
MGRKSILKVEEDVYTVLAGFLEGKIGGTVYKSGMRPLDARTEDAVVVVSTVDSGQIQEGRVHVNIYTEDVDFGGGNLVEDKTRNTELSALDEPMAEALNDALPGEYSFNLSQATGTFAEEGLHQHFVSVYLDFKRVTF